MTLYQFAEEINKTWTSNYKAEVKNNELIVSYESIEKNWIECAFMDSNFNISGDDEDAIGQLEYMVSR